MRLPSVIVAGLLFALLCQETNAKQQWSDNSFTWLYGSRYEIGDAKRQVLTFEHASGHDWGDLFLFVDRMDADVSHLFYAEFSPRVQLKALSSAEQISRVQALFLAYTLEAGESSSVSFNHHLLGPSVNVAVPGFRYLKLTLFRRFNDGTADNWQLTQAFAIPIHIGQTAFLYDGFIDWTSTSEDKYSSLNFTSQLKWDLGQTLGRSKNKLYLGVEYVYWRNKFGIKNSRAFDTLESNVNMLLKVHL